MTAAPVRVSRRGWQETLAIVLLLVGGIVWGFGWLVGVVLLWLSEVWTLRDKLIGTLVVPGGLSLPIFLSVFIGLGANPSGVAQAALIVLLVSLVALQIAAAVYLARRAVRPA